MEVTKYVVRTKWPNALIKILNGNLNISVTFVTSL